MLSIIIPAGPGDNAWMGLWSELPGGAGIERLLVLPEDDPRRDGPPAGRLLHAPAGRAKQLNAGLSVARGRTVWLLHADSRPDHRAMRAALAFAQAPEPVLGYFKLGFHDGPPTMAVNAFGANVRSRWFGIPFGDQGFLAPRSLFKSLGGFDVSVGRGEDHAFVHAVHRAGIPLRRLSGRVDTSARRYIDHGWWRTTREHLALTWQQRRAFSRGATR